VVREWRRGKGKKEKGERLGCTSAHKPRPDFASPVQFSLFLDLGFPVRPRLIRV
jgi:hypothetical protein